MKSFLDGLKPRNTFICFTHCDKLKDDKFFTAKIKSISKYTNLEIPNHNVIKFDYTAESLKDFVANMVEGDIHIPEDMDDRLDEFDCELPRVAKQVDENEGTRLT